MKHAREAVLAAPYTDVPPPGHHIHRVFKAEYCLMPLLNAYPLPVVSLCQGVWMGLGVGLSVFGRYRVVTDSTVFAMPENAIGAMSVGGFPEELCAPNAAGLVCWHHRFMHL